MTELSCVLPFIALYKYFVCFSTFWSLKLYSKPKYDRYMAKLREWSLQLSYLFHLSAGNNVKAICLVQSKPFLFFFFFFFFVFNNSSWMMHLILFVWTLNFSHFFFKWRHLSVWIPEQYGSSKQKLYSENKESASIDSRFFAFRIKRFSEGRQKQFWWSCLPWIQDC